MEGKPVDAMPAAGNVNQNTNNVVVNVTAGGGGEYYVDPGCCMKCCCPPCAVGQVYGGCKCPECALAWIFGCWYTLCCWFPATEKRPTGAPECEECEK